MGRFRGICTSFMARVVNFYTKKKISNYPTIARHSQIELELRQ
jgi:hypothetical protein